MTLMTKKPEDGKADRILCKYTKRCRIGLKSILQCWVRYKNIKTILVPAYIGISPNEGSGIIDPIEETTGLKIKFYLVDRLLSVDMKDLKTQISKLEDDDVPFVFLRVNWFGFYDKNWKNADNYIHQCGGYVIEDNAHAFFTSYRHTDRMVDASIYSLHKAFPFHEGGMIKIYNSELGRYPYTLCSDVISPQYDFNQYDFSEISKKCRENFKILENQCREYTDYFESVRTLENDDITVPQSFPLLLKRGDRFRVYLSMNERGYGITSLYHTMVPQLIPEKYPDAAYVSSRILNLPVHQDICPELYPAMLKDLLEFIRKF